MYTDKENEIDENQNSEWESELMLKDSAWSLIKGKKIPNDDMTQKTTPIIIRHDNTRGKVNANKPEFIPKMNLAEVTDGEKDEDDDNQGEEMEVEIPAIDHVKITAPIYQNKPESVLKNSITVECPRMNESTYRGTINYTGAKKKIFCNGLGLSLELLSAVRMTFKTHPIIQFKLTEEIDITTIPKSSFTIERKYHSGGIFLGNKHILNLTRSIKNQTTYKYVLF